MMLGITTLLTTLLVLVTAQAKGEVPRYESDLYDKLLKGYKPNIRPVQKANETVVVRFGIALHNLNELDEKNQKLSLTLWIREAWEDQFLKWNPQDYGNITTMRIPSDLIWKPDIVLYNTRNDRYEHVMDVNCVVRSDGLVLWIPPINLESSCTMNMKHFPFDDQECELKFGSWTFNGVQVTLDFYDDIKEFDLSDYHVSPEWAIVENKAAFHEKYYPCCKEPYPDMTFTVKLQRKSSYYAYMFATPGVAITILIPFMFLLPASSTQKVPLGVGVAVCLVLLLSMLENFLPSALPTPPIIATHYVGNLVIVCISLALNALFANLSHRGHRNNSPPEVMKRVFIAGFRKLVCVTYDPANDREPETTSALAIREWETIGLVIDRLLFVIFLIAVIIESITVLHD